MGGTSKSTQQSSTQQASQTNPWEPTQGILKDILGGVQGQVGNYQPTSAEQGALGTIQNNAAGSQNYGGQATGLANDLMAGGGTAANAGIMSDAYKNYQTQLSPYANGQNLDPSRAPGMSQLLETIRNDVGNSVNGMFAGAGRDMSGMNQQSLARGIAQGEAAPLLNQYNQNVQNQLGAAGSLYGAGGQTAQGLQGFNQQGFDNRSLGLSTAINGVPQAQNANATNVLNAGSLARNLPLQNLGMLSNLTIPIAGLGSQSSGTSNMQGQGTYTMSPAQQAWGWAKAAGDMTKTAGQGLGILGSFF